MTVDPALDAARMGDRAAIQTLLEVHYDRIALICRRMMANRDDAEDATQEALVAIVAGLRRFDGRSSFTTWAHRVAVNACLDELRRRSRRLRLVEETGADHRALHGADRDPHPDQFVGERIDLDRALGELPVEFRAPVVLRDLLGYDYSDIAELLDLPPGTVRSRIARGRRRLVALLECGNPEGLADVEHPGELRPRPPTPT